jgi:hypothetical protein
MRIGTILSAIGLGAAIGLTMVAIAAKKEEFLFLAGLGFINFFIGLGFIINGIFLTNPKSGPLPTPPSQPDTLTGNTNDLRLAEPPAATFTSVTEHTTHHLQEKQPRE